MQIVFRWKSEISFLGRDNTMLLLWWLKIIRDSNVYKIDIENVIKGIQTHLTYKLLIIELIILYFTIICLKNEKYVSPLNKKDVAEFIVPSKPNDLKGNLQDIFNDRLICNAFIMLFYLVI